MYVCTWSTYLASCLQCPTLFYSGQLMSTGAYLLFFPFALVVVDL